MKSHSRAAGGRARRCLPVRDASVRRRARLAAITLFVANGVLAAPMQAGARRLEDSDLFAAQQIASTSASYSAPSFEAETAPSEDVDARTRYLVERLDARRKHASLWYRSWFAVYAGGFAFSTLRASIANGDVNRTDSIVSGVKASIGIADLLLRPIEARYGGDPIRALPGETEPQRLARLEAAEKQLVSNAKRASHTRDWRVHLSSLGLNLAGAGALLIVGSPKRAAESFAIGEVFSELAIYTEPVTPARDWDDYEARRNARNWTLAPMGLGLAFRTTF